MINHRLIGEKASLYFRINQLKQKTNQKHKSQYYKIEQRLLNYENSIN